MKKWQLGAGSLLVIAGTFVAFTGGMPNPPADSAASEITVRIAVGERQLHVEQNGEVIGTYVVAVGKDGHATPTGNFSVKRIIWNPRWVPPKAAWAKNKVPREAGDPRNPMGRVKVFFKEPDYYVHGTNDEKSLGSAASHGCVRMANEDIIQLATLLMEHGGAAVEPGLVQRLINRVRQTKEVRLTNPIPLQVQA